MVFCLTEVFLVSQNVTAGMYIIVYAWWSHWLSVDSDYALSNECPDTSNTSDTILKDLEYISIGTQLNSVDSDYTLSIYFYSGLIFQKSLLEPPL